MSNRERDHESERLLAAALGDDTPAAWIASGCADVPAGPVTLMCDGCSVGVGQGTPCGDMAEHAPHYMESDD